MNAHQAEHQLKSIILDLIAAENALDFKNGTTLHYIRSARATAFDVGDSLGIELVNQDTTM